MGRSGGVSTTPAPTGQLVLLTRSSVIHDLGDHSRMLIRKMPYI